MNILYWGEMDLEAMEDERGAEPDDEERHPAEIERSEPRLQTVTESESGRSAEEETLINQWLAERECSGL